MSITNGQNGDAGDFVSTSSGAGSSGKVAKLNASGQIDVSFLAWKGAVTSGTATHDISITGAQTIAHGLGFIPKIVRLSVFISTSTTFSQVVATYIASTLNSIGVAKDTSTGSYNSLSAPNLFTSISSTFATFSCAVDATNITLTWTKTGTPSSTATILWEALA